MWSELFLCMWSYMPAYVCVRLGGSAADREPSDDWFTDVHFPSALQGELDLRRRSLMADFCAV